MAAELHDLLSQNFPQVEPFTKPDEEELLVFGYSCKLFRDDERALFLDQGKHLIPWMGDESLQIDRYDVRGYLADLYQHEAQASQSHHPYWELLSPEEKHIEQLCEEERYLALYSDLTEEQIYHEEELKRLKAALADEGAYHEIGFSYEDSEKHNTQFQTQEPEEKDTEDEPFCLPDGLVLPEDIPVPETMKHHTIIERTAVFVSQHGNQMEIVIKSKQASNPLFSFLSFDSSLNPYYKYLVASIKTGKYQPKPPEPEKPEVEMMEEEDSDDDHYLHPSLLGGKKDQPDPVNIPDLPVFKSVNDAYSKLVKNLMERSARSRESSPVTKEPPLPPPPMFTSMETYWQHFGGPPVESPHLVMAYNNQPPPPGDESLYQMFTQSVGGDVIYHMLPPPPPPDIQPIIDKMAEYVARSGEDFEMVVKSKRDKRFEFLSSHHEYHQYYLYKKKCHVDLRKQQLERLQKMNEEASPKKKGTPTTPEPSSPPAQVKSGPVAPVSFSIKSKDCSDSSKDKKCFPLAGEMDSEEEGGGNQSREEQEQNDSAISPASIAANAKNRLMEQLVAAAVVNIPPPASPPKPTEEEVLAKKILEAKAAEARLAGERLRDKLANAAREKMAQQTKERQLQLERKRKAALFLNMLKSSGSVVPPAKPAERTPAVYGPHMPPSFEGAENGSASERSSPVGAKSPVSDNEFQASTDVLSEKPQSRSHTSHRDHHSRTHLPEHQKSPKHHSSEGKRSSKSRSSKDHKRHKTPPSSYSFIRRSRSRSLSPKRHHRPKSKERSHRR